MPSLEDAAELVRVAGVSLDWLAYGTEAPPIDEELLRQAIQVVEEWLLAGGLDLPAAKKAVAVEALYSIGMEKPAGERHIAPADVRRVLRLVG